MNLLDNLKRRNVFKAGLSYLVFSWLVLQVMAIVFPILSINMAYQRWALIALVIGFPAWLVFAYIYEWTPDGFRQTGKVETNTAFQESTNRRANRYIILGLSLAVILLVTDRVFNMTGNIGKQEAKLSTIAVLPFSEQSEEESDAFFTAGVHEDLMTKLAGVHDFRIISKSSVMPYKDFEGDLKEVGEKLNVDYIMQGSVRRWEDQIRMTVQLIESGSDQAIWSHEYNGKLDNVFELQADIANVITQKLQANLSKAEVNELGTAPTTVLSAYDDYLKARFIINQPRPSYEELLEAIDLLDRATDADEKFANAWSLKVLAYGEVYNKLSSANEKSEDLTAYKANAEEALEKAKALAPDSWQVLSDLGIYYMYVEQDMLSALSAFEKALEQNPSDVIAMRQLSQLYVQLGDLEKGTEMLERGFELTQSSGFMSYSLTFAYEIQGMYKKMIPLLERLGALYPEDKHYLVEAKYYQFLDDGTLNSFNAFQEMVKTSDAVNSWDERAMKNMEMIVAMFNDDFEDYHEDWKGKHEQHIRGHGDWMCPLVANDFLNQARLMLKHDHRDSARAILTAVNDIVLRPINPNSVCIFNPEAYLPKLEFMTGNTETAADKIEALAIPILQNESFPTGAVERSVLLEAFDLIKPDKVYYYYEQIVKNSISLTSFESICADPWTYPNLIKDPRFIKEVRADGRFVEFLEAFDFI